MAGKGEGAGAGSISKLENQITVLKYTLLFSNVIIWMIAASIFALCLWLRFEPIVEEWIDKLDIYAYYVGVYILIFATVLVMVVAFVGCLGALQENHTTILVYAISQVVCFLCGSIGSAFLLEFSSKDSYVERLIKESIRRLIINSHHEPSRQTLYMIQESVGCCGAEGPNDYLNLIQPIPNQCRDSVTGNPFYHGCVDEMIWFFEDKALWITGLAMAVCFIHICNAVMSITLIQALKKEDEESDHFRR